MRVSTSICEPYTEAPTPLDDSRPSGWKPEAWDENLPWQGGFVRDFVLGTRGIESPTAFCAWAALWAVSAAVRRSAWVQMYPKRMYPNLYVVFVAPPAICKKGTAINFAAEIVRRITDYIPDESLRRIKEVRMVMNKITPEALVKRIKPLELLLDGEEEPLDLGSQIVIIAPELSVLMGKQTYNTGLIELLLDLYDCPDYWEYTKSAGQDGMQAGVISLRKSFISMIAASTPDGLSLSVPETAFGDGFMSRLIPVFQDMDTRVFADPFKPAGAPTQVELARRLSWISTNNVGEYEMDEEAHEWWVGWYEGEFARIRRTLSDKDARSRFDVTLRKLSLVMRLQRYTLEPKISLPDVLDAKRVLDATYAKSMRATEDVGLSSFMRNVKAVERRLTCKGAKTRRQLLTQVRGWRDAQECTRALQHLHDIGRINIYLDGKLVDRASSRGDEVYVSLEEVDDQEREDSGSVSGDRQHGSNGKQPGSEQLHGVARPTRGKRAKSKGVRKARKKKVPGKAVGVRGEVDPRAPKELGSGRHVGAVEEERLLTGRSSVLRVQEEDGVEVVAEDASGSETGEGGAFLARR